MPGVLEWLGRWYNEERILIVFVEVLQMSRNRQEAKNYERGLNL